MNEPTEEQRQAAVVVAATVRDVDDPAEWAVQYVARALAEAEARGMAWGRAELAARVEALAVQFDGYYGDEGDWGVGRESAFSDAADRLRAILADTDGTQP